MSAFPPRRGGGGLVGAFAHMADRIVDALNQLFGFQYTSNAEHYEYGVTIRTGSTDAIGTSYNAQVSITQEADFIATRLNANARIAGTGVIIGMSSANAGAAGDLPDAPFTLQIVEGSNDRQLHNQAIDASIGYSTYGGLPGIWARPRLFARNTIITYTLTSLKLPAAAWDYRIVLIGWKIYDARALNLTSRS